MANVALLASVADQTASQLAGAVSELIPSGVILPYGGATAPAGWLLCDGSTKDRTQYAKLFSAIGTAHGTGNGTTTFHLPDLRGRFLRGVDGGQGRDPDRTTRAVANAGGNTGDAVGSIQLTATKVPGTAFTGTAATGGAHSHSVRINGYAAGVNATGAVYGNSFDNNSGFSTGLPPGTAEGSHSHTVSISGGGDNESRPPNANVNYIIKV